MSGMNWLRYVVSSICTHNKHFLTYPKGNSSFCFLRIPMTHGEAEDENLRLLLRKEVILDLHSSAVKSFSMPKQTCVAWEGKTRGRKEELKTFLLALPVISLLRFPCKLHCREPLFGKEWTPNVWKKELQKRHFCLKWYIFFHLH